MQIVCQYQPSAQTTRFSNVVNRARWVTLKAVIKSVKLQLNYHLAIVIVLFYAMMVSKCSIKQNIGNDSLGEARDVQSEVLSPLALGWYTLDWMFSNC